MLKEILENLEIKKVEKELEDKVKKVIDDEFQKVIDFIKENEKEAKENREKYFNTTWKKYNDKIKDILFYFVYPGNYEKDKQEIINKIRKNFDKKIDEIIKKIDSKIKDAKDFKKIYETPYLTVYEITTNNNEVKYFKFETIFAGGINIQKPHTRFVIQITKTPPKNII